ncbi:hypothetical protein MA16_Dca015314 [Dendrobium catenatum]|uniref:Uncharacterized protein n=1 Tax=Dendrobium catenatum TaxID=906689 RepID=A0A2I0X043_9ASPA|nr:hypothetical protein MA16_Dca015314 [Dendrobium catenatum]
MFGPQVVVLQMSRPQVVVRQNSERQVVVWQKFKTQGGLAEFRASGDGLAELKASSSGSAKLRATSGGPAELRVSSGGPARLRASSGGLTELMALSGGLLELQSPGVFRRREELRRWSRRSFFLLVRPRSLTIPLWLGFSSQNRPSKTTGMEFDQNVRRILSLFDFGASHFSSIFSSSSLSSLESPLCRMRALFIVFLDCGKYFLRWDRISESSNLCPFSGERSRSIGIQQICFLSAISSAFLTDLFYLPDVLCIQWGSAHGRDDSMLKSDESDLEAKSRTIEEDKELEKTDEALSCLQYSCGSPINQRNKGLFDCRNIYCWDEVANSNTRTGVGMAEQIDVGRMLAAVVEEEEWRS